MAVILFMGVYIYDELPSEMRLSTCWEDLFFGNTPRAGMWFMVGPYNDGKYVARQLKEHHTRDDLNYDLGTGRVYVKEGKSKMQNI